jgi:hypothetical protein
MEQRKLGNGNATRRDSEKLNFQATDQASLLTIALPRGFLVSASVIHLFLKMARKVDDADNFVFVQLIGQEPGIYDKRYPDYARRDKIRDT